MKELSKKETVLLGVCLVGVVLGLSTIIVKFGIPIQAFAPLLVIAVAALVVWLVWQISRVIVRIARPMKDPTYSEGNSNAELFVFVASLGLLVVAAGALAPYFLWPAVVALAFALLVAAFRIVRWAIRWAIAFMLGLIDRLKISR